MPAPFDPTRFHQLLRTESFGRNLIFEPAVGSTMDVARDAAVHGAAEGTVALADEQTAGRGRLGRSWITPRGATLASTLLLRPPLSVLRQVAMITPLAICQAVESVVGLKPDIKWPNDVQLSGKKLAGVLIESDVSETAATVLVGVGINCNFDPRKYDEIRDIATSLYVETGREVEREALFAGYLLQFEILYKEAKNGTSMRDRWRARMTTLGKHVHARWPGGEADGVAHDVDDDGSLLIKRDDGTTVTLEAGDVTLRA
jgi:BirA family biotin operon repressor/biotin-[acetyl-CoA-carboxylase] ligase